MHIVSQGIFCCFGLEIVAFNSCEVSVCFLSLKELCGCCFLRRGCRYNVYFYPGFDGSVSDIDASFACTPVDCVLVR